MPITPIATGNSGLTANVNVNDLLGRFLGSSGSTSESGSQSTQNSGSVKNTGTTTTSTSMSPEAMQAMLKSILEGTSGLAATAMGEHAAGLYDSSTNTLLQNDLITRAAAQVAQNTKSQTVTQDTAQTDTRGSVTNSSGNKSTVQNPQIKPSSAAKAASVVGALSLVPKDIRDQVWQKVKGVGSAINNAPDSGQLATAGQVGAANDATSASDYASAFPTSPSVNADSIDQAVQGVGMGSGDLTSIGYDPGALSAVGDAASSVGDVADAVGDVGDIGGFAGDATSIGYDPGAFDEAGNAIGDAVSSSGSFFEDLGQFFADGGLVDPNDKTKSVPSNLDFSQHNAVVQAVQAALAGRSKAAGYADGGNVAQSNDSNMFTRRTASIDAQTDAAVSGTQVSMPAQQAASAPAPAQARAPIQPSKLDLLVRGLLKKFADGGVIPHYDDGGLLPPDLTNLGLQIQPTTSSNSSHLGVINSPTKDDSSGTAIIGDAAGKGTGFANTGNLSSVSNAPTVSVKRPPSITTPVGGESNSAAPGTAQGGIDSSPNAVGNAALSLGLAALGLGILTPLAQAVSNSVGSSTAASAAADATADSAVGSVSVGGLSAGDTGIDGNVGSIGAVSDSEGMSGVGPSASDAGAATSDGDSTSTADSSGVGNSAAAGTGDSGDSGSAGDGGSGYAKGGAITGPGDETSDSVDAKLSSGEFVINAEATSRFRPFLEMINNAFKAR